MERRQLEYFLAVIDHGGFTSAATALHVSQPALSAAVKSLEKDLGALLFHRLPRGVRLTEAGTEFAQPARMIMRELDTARARVDAVKGLIAGRLDIISLPGMLLDPLAPVIGRFRRRHPRVRVRVVQAEAAEDVRNAVRAGDAELGLTDAVEAADKDVVGEPILEQELVAVLPPGTPPPPAGVLTLEDLLRMDVITGPPGTAIRDVLTREGARLGLEVGPRLRSRRAARRCTWPCWRRDRHPAPPGGAARRSARRQIVSLQPSQTRLVYLLRRDAPLSPAAHAIHALLSPEGNITERG